MPIYKQTTEITNIDDLLSSVERDIEEVYFGDKNVFTVWGEYEGTLPATLNANGDNAKQYKVYGAAGGVGDRTANLLDFDELLSAPSGEMGIGNFTHLLELQLKPNTTYIAASNGRGSVSGSADENRSLYFNGSAQSDCVFRNHRVTVTTDNTGVVHFGFFSERTNAQQYISGNAHVWLVEGATAPATYIPFGYEVDILTSDGTTVTTTPVYIGDEPLDKDEYVDYQAGKIYRYETEMKKDVSQAGWMWRWETDNVTYQATLSNRVSVGRFYPEDTKEYIISAVPDTFEVAVISADSSDVKAADTGWGASWTLSGASAHSFCVTVRKSDNSDITPSEVDGVKFKVTSSLTPTDSPVTLPALPTCEGTTIVDYAGSGTAPEKAILKYRKKNS